MSEPRHCEHCRHWNPAAEDSRKPVGYGSCNATAWKAGYFVPDAAPDGVVVEDDEGWGFYTGPQFGCIHWTAKELRK